MTEYLDEDITCKDCYHKDAVKINTNFCDVNGLCINWAHCPNCKATMYEDEIMSLYEAIED